MSILNVNFEALDDSPHSSSTPTLRVDNVDHFTLADFESYCNSTETNSKDKAELVNKDSDETTDLLNSQELCENLDNELSVNQQLWLDNSHPENNELDNTLTLSSSLYSNNEQQPVPIQTSSEGQNYITIKSSNSAVIESPTKISWPDIRRQDPDMVLKSSEYIITRSDNFSNFQGTMNTSTFEKARPISSTSSHANDHEVTNYLTEVVNVPQVYSQTQPNAFRVELGNDGQQYMIMDGKYLSDNINDMSAYNVGSNQYYLAGTQLLTEYPTINHSSAAHSISTGGVSTSTYSTINPMSVYQNYTENEGQVIDKEVLAEQKRKEQMQIRRREKNKDCSRAFRRNQKEKERKLRESKIQKQARLKELNRKNENFIRMLSKAALQGCDKAKQMTTNCMTTWNKENKCNSAHSSNV